MDLNKIKLLRKDEFLQKLKQSGFSDVVTILEDKEINGEKFIELKEFETFRWKLSPAQKKKLWDCIREIRAKPSVLAVKEKPKLVKRPSLQRAENTNEAKLFKGKLESLLGPATTSVGSSSSLPTLSLTPRAGQLEDRSSLRPNSIKKPALPLPVKARQTENAIRKPALPLPREIENTDEYLDMHPPKQMNNNNEPDDGYLTPIDLEENDYEAPPKVAEPSKFPTKNVTFPTKVNAPAKKAGIPIPPPPPSKNTINVTRIVNSRRFESNNVINSEEDSYEDVLSPPNLPRSPLSQNRISIGIRNIDNNLPDLDRKQLPRSGNKALSTDSENESQPNKIGQNVERSDFSKDGKSPPSLKSTLPNNTKREQNTNEVLGESNIPSTKKTSFKDLENVLIIDEKESSLSKISYTLSNIFRKNKSKNSYENYPIESETKIVPITEGRKFFVKERPLPTIPSFTEEKTIGRFSKPFPLPREDIPYTDPAESYVELIRNLPDHLTQSSVSQNSGEKGGITPQKGKFPSIQNFSTSPPVQDSVHSTPHSKNSILNQEELLEYGNVVTNNNNQQTPIQNQLVSILAQQLKERDLRINKENRKSIASLFDSDFDDEFDDDDEAENQPVYGNTPDQSRNSKSLNLQADDECGSYGNIETENTLRSNLKTSTATQNRTSFLFSYKGRSTIPNAFNTPQENSRPNQFLLMNASSISTSHEEMHNNNAKKGNFVPIFKRPLPEIPEINSNTSGIPTPENKRPISTRGLLTPPSSDDERNDKENATYGNVDPEPKLKKPLHVTSSNALSRPFVLNKKGEDEDELFSRPLPKPPTVTSTQLNYEHYLPTPGDDKKANNRPINVAEDEIQKQRMSTNLNDEPFFRNTDRKGARALLRNFEDGAFLIRPGGRYPLALTVKYKNKYYNLGIEKNSNGRLHLHADHDCMSPDFASLRDFVNYFIEKPVTFQENGTIVEICLKPVLPPDLF